MGALVSCPSSTLAFFLEQPGPVTSSRYASCSLDALDLQCALDLVEYRGVIDGRRLPGGMTS